MPSRILVNIVSVVAVGGLALAGKSCYDGRQRERGALEVRIADLTRSYDSLVREEKVSDTIYIRAVDTLRKVRWRTDSILSVDTLRLIRVDTVRVMIAAERRACDQLVSTCEDQKALLRRENANLQKRLTLQKPPGWLKRTLGKVVWAGAGFAAGRIVR